MLDGDTVPHMDGEIVSVGDIESDVDPVREFDTVNDTDADDVFVVVEDTVIEPDVEDVFVVDGPVLSHARSQIALETDLLALLPKPDGAARAIYTGSIHPSSITDFALATPLYFGELILAHPFVHPGVMKKEMSPTCNPKSYRKEFLKTILFFLNVMPLVDLGLINLIAISGHAVEGGWKKTELKS